MSKTRFNKSKYFKGVKYNPKKWRPITPSNKQDIAVFGNITTPSTIAKVNKQPKDYIYYTTISNLHTGNIKFNETSIDERRALNSLSDRLK